MTNKQELEQLAKWLGIEVTFMPDGICRDVTGFHPAQNVFAGKPWNPSPTGNSDDFLNMVAGRVDIEFYPRLHPVKAIATARVGLSAFIAGREFGLYNNDKVATMKHAAYQVCLMAAKECKEQSNG